MQNFSAQDITYANYKEKMDLILKNCKQNEIILKNQQRKSISRSNSREKSLNSKQKQPTPMQKQVKNIPNASSDQQQGSKKNLTRNRNLSITTSCDKKQNSNQLSNQKLFQNGNNTCTNSKVASSYPIQSGSMSVQNKNKKTPQGGRNQSNSLHQSNSVTKKHNTNSNNNNNINISNTGNQINPHQLSNSLTPGLRGEQYHNFSSFFSSQSTKNNINNNLLNNSIQGNQQPQKNSDKITLFLQHLQSSDSPMKQIQQIQDRLQSYHHNHNALGAQHQNINNNKQINQQNLNSSITTQTMNLNNSYCNNNLDPQQQQGLNPRQRVNSNDCVFNINQSSITGGMQSEQYDPYRASFSHQESLQLNNEQISASQNQKGVAQVNLKLNQLSKSMKNTSPQKNNFIQKKNVFSLHSSTSSVDPQKCLLNQFEEQYTPSSQMAQQNKFIDLSGANIQISDIMLDKKMNINELNISHDKLNILSLKEIPVHMKGNSVQHKQYNSEAYDINDGGDEILAASMPTNCKLGEDYLRTPKQNIFCQGNKSQQLPYQHTPITNNQPKQTQINNQKQEEKNRSKSLVSQQDNQFDFLASNQQNPEKMFQKRRALTIADDSYDVLNNENNNHFVDSMQVNHTYHGDNNSLQYNKLSRKLLIPKIKNFDQMIEEKNQQMDYEIPPHVYNETFQGEEYISSQNTSDIRSETYDSLNQTQNLDNNLNQDSISIHPTLKQNPMQGYRNIMKAMEISGKDNDVEIRALKITIRKLQYRDAVLRQKIAKMSTQSQEQLQTIQKLDAENSELINQVNAYAEQHEIHEQQISQLQYEMQSFQQQFQHLGVDGLNKSSDLIFKNQAEQFEQTIEDMRQKIIDYEQIVTELREQLSEQEKNEENLNQQINQKEEEIQKQQYEFLEKLAEFQEENIRISQQVKAEQEQVQGDEKAQLAKQIADLNSENEKLYDQITSLLKENEQYKQQREVVSNVNDLSLKSLKLLDDNSKLIEENRTLQANILILNKDNQQLKEGLQSLQQQILQQQELITKRVEENAYKKLVEDSQNTIKEMKQINQELLYNISNLEVQNKELSTRCSTLEIKLNSQNESMKQYSNNQSKDQSPKEKSLIEKISNLQKEITAEKEKSETLEKKIIQMSQKNSLNQSIQSKQEYQCEEINRIRVENDELRKELEDQYKEKECLEEVLKNYLLQRELEKLKMNGEQNTLKDQEQDEEIAEVFQSDSKINGFLNSQQRTNMDLNSQLLNYFSNSNQNKPSSANQNLTENYNLYKRNSNCTITNGNNTNYQISITECSQLSLLEEDDGNRINEDEDMDPNEELQQTFKRNILKGGNENQQMQDQQNISNMQHIVSTNTNINNNNFNNNNNTVNSNNQLKKSSASSSHFLREIDTSTQHKQQQQSPQQRKQQQLQQQQQHQQLHQQSPSPISKYKYQSIFKQSPPKLLTNSTSLKQLASVKFTSPQSLYKAGHLSSQSKIQRK